MKKIFITLVLCCFYASLAWSAMIIQQFTTSGGATLLFEGDWTGVTSSTDHTCAVAGGCSTNSPTFNEFDSESGSIFSVDTTNKWLDFTVVADGTVNQYVKLSSGAGEVLENLPDEFWYTVKIKIDDTVNQEDNDFGYNLAKVYWGAGLLDWLSLETTSGQGFTGVRLKYRVDGGGSVVLCDTAWNPADDTWYTMRWHMKIDDDGGTDVTNTGVLEFDIVGEDLPCSKTDIDNDTIPTVADIHVGTYLAQHDGVNDWTISYDNVQIYTTDPGWSF